MPTISGQGFGRRLPSPPADALHTRIIGEYQLRMRDPRARAALRTLRVLRGRPWRRGSRRAARIARGRPALPVSTIVCRPSAAINSISRYDGSKRGRIQAHTKCELTGLGAASTT
jgi:hypothetical protein